MGKLALLAFVGLVSCGGRAAEGQVTLTPTTSATAPATTASALPQTTAKPPATTACTRKLSGTSICFGGGEGTSMQDAIVIQGAHGESDGVAAEYTYLEGLYGPRGQGYLVHGQSLLEDGGKSFDRLDIEVKGQPKSYFFDITDYFGKF